MKAWQIVLLAAVAVLLVAVTILTWGSLGSAATLLCLISLCSALLFQKFMTNRDPDEFEME